MTIEAPTHLERRELVDSWHFVHRTMAFQALLVGFETLEDALVGINMSVMREPYEAREFMHFDPLDGTPFIPRSLQLLNFWVPRPGQEVTTHARGHRRKTGTRADFRRKVTIPAIHLVLGHVDIVPIKHRLDRPLKTGGVDIDRDRRARDLHVLRRPDGHDSQNDHRRHSKQRPGIQIYSLFHVSAFGGINRSVWRAPLR